MNKLNHIFFNEELKKLRVSKIKIFYIDLQKIRETMKATEIVIRDTTSNVIGAVVQFDQANRNGDIFTIRSDNSNQFIFNNTEVSMTLNQETLTQWASQLSADNRVLITSSGNIGINIVNSSHFDVRRPLYSFQKKPEKKVMMNKYSEIFFEEETKRTKNILKNAKFKGYFYLDLHKIQAEQITYSISSNGNVGIGQ